MTDYLAEARRYAPEADEAAVAGIVKHFGIAMAEGKDSSFVAATDPTEMERVREKFLKKKCGLTLPDAELDAALQEVADQMKGDNHKLRSTFCYLLAAKFDKLDLFRG